MGHHRFRDDQPPTYSLAVSVSSWLELGLDFESMTFWIKTQRFTSELFHISVT